MSAFDGLMRRHGWEFNAGKLTATKTISARSVEVAQLPDATYVMKCLDNGLLFAESKHSHPGPAFDAGYGLLYGTSYPKDTQW